MNGAQRVLDRLADGDWHSSYSLTHELQVMTHSRISELRRDGHLIEKRRVPGETGLRAYEYRLVSGGVDEQVVTGSAPTTRDDGGALGYAAASSTPVRRPMSSPDVVALLDREGFAEAEEQLALV